MVDYIRKYPSKYPAASRIPYLRDTCTILGLAPPLSFGSAQPDGKHSPLTHTSLYVKFLTLVNASGRVPA